MKDKKSNKQSFSTYLGILVMLIALMVSYFIYHEILGNPSNFVGKEPSNEPLEGNYLGIIHKGGSIVILQLSFMIILLAYIIERAVSLSMAGGKGNNKHFANSVELNLHQGNYDEIENLADQQRGSVGNVVRKGIASFQKAEKEANWTEEEKAYRLKTELEEATHLEVPVLEKNMIILSTLASIATLIGLLGTVTGMIRAFSALARSGTPDAVGLAAGISQALVTTALGISTAAVAIVFYNIYTNMIDKVTYAIDETNYAILNHFKEKVEKKRA